MRYCRKVDPDRFLMTRAGIYYYRRRIPAVVAARDTRLRFSLMRISLKTDDLAEARAKRDVLEAADNDYWATLITDLRGRSRALMEYRAAVRRVEALGFTYRTSSEIASGPLKELVRRIWAIMPENTPNEDVAAVLGQVERPEVSWWDAYEVYKAEINKQALSRKSPAQLRRWESTMKGAISHFISLVGDKSIDATTREDARKLYKHWLKNIVPDDRTQKRYSPSTGNKRISVLRHLYSAYFKHLGEDRQNPFSGFNFSEDSGQKRKPFSREWIESRILAPGALSGLNNQARGITLALIETGCRPGEICNIAAEDVFLDAEVPYIHIQARDRLDDARQLKTPQSDRKIPLVGVALEVFKQHPNGFPRYKDKENSFSATVNKFLRENGLKPSPNHTVYSFRHSFEDRMLESKIDLEVREVLMGHKLQRPLYGEKGTLQFRQELLSAMAFDFEPVIVGSAFGSH